MTHRLLFLLVVFACLVPTTRALAGPEVPDVPVADLPQAGVCAPIASEHVTWLTVGALGKYRIDGNQADVDATLVERHLTGAVRAATAAGAKHEVWMVVSRRALWQRVVDVLFLCHKVGIFRVGIQVRAESGEGLFGFPLFLPSGDDTGAGSMGKARSLAVVMKVVEEAPSSPSRLYAAAKAAVERFHPVVAELSVPPDAAVGDAVQAIDLLYRAGCVWVRTAGRMGARSTKRAGFVRMFVGPKLRELESDHVDVTLAPIRPRKQPWPDSGAARPGAHRYVLEPVPSGDRRAPATAQHLPLPSYAEDGREVPPAAFAASAEAVQDWAGILGAWLRHVMRPGKTQFPGGLLVKRKRQGSGVDQFFAEARRTFPAPELVTVSTVRVRLLLFKGADVVGQADLTILVSAKELGLVFGSWVAGEYPPGARLPPRATDPYAARVPGHLRVWVEGVLAKGRVHGAGALPLAKEADVLAQLPAVAHPGVRAAIAGRNANLQNLVGWLRATPFDRVVVATAEGSAAVVNGSRVDGVLRYALESENGDLRLASMKARAAPR